jgi:hypothetical protein
MENNWHIIVSGGENTTTSTEVRNKAPLTCPGRNSDGCKGSMQCCSVQEQGADRDGLFTSRPDHISACCECWPLPSRPLPHVPYRTSPTARRLPHVAYRTSPTHRVPCPTSPAPASPVSPAPRALVKRRVCRLCSTPLIFDVLLALSQSLNGRRFFVCTNVTLLRHNRFMAS